MLQTLRQRIAARHCVNALLTLVSSFCIVQSARGESLNLLDVPPTGVEISDVDAPRVSLSTDGRIHYVLRTMHDDQTRLWQGSAPGSAPVQLARTDRNQRTAIKTPSSPNTEGTFYVTYEKTSGDLELWTYNHLGVGMLVEETGAFVSDIGNGAPISTGAAVVPIVTTGGRVLALAGPGIATQTLTTAYISYGTPVVGASLWAYLTARDSDGLSVLGVRSGVVDELAALPSGATFSPTGGTARGEAYGTLQVAGQPTSGAIIANDQISSFPSTTGLEPNGFFVSDDLSSFVRVFSDESGKKTVTWNDMVVLREDQSVGSDTLVRFHVGGVQFDDMNRPTIGLDVILRDSGTRAMLLSPVPEPETYLLLFSGCAILVAWKLRLRLVRFSRKLSGPRDAGRRPIEVASTWFIGGSVS